MTCRAESAMGACSWRVWARGSDTLRFSPDLMAWVWHASPQLVTLVTRCPGCGGQLPNPAVMAPQWAKGDYGEGPE